MKQLFYDLEDELALPSHRSDDEEGKISPSYFALTFLPFGTVLTSVLRATYFSFTRHFLQFHAALTSVQSGAYFSSVRHLL